MKKGLVVFVSTLLVIYSTVKGTALAVSYKVPSL